jgi:hypothetical protein
MKGITSRCTRAAVVALSWPLAFLALSRCSSPQSHGPGGAGGNTCAPASAAPVDGSFAADASTTVPIGLVQRSPTDVRFWIPVSVGGVQVDAVLDTGSAGLVLFGELPDASIELTDAQVGARYNGGLQICGVKGNALVTIGSLATATPVPIFVVTQMCGCQDTCEAGVPPDAGFDGFAVLLGIGLHGASTAPGAVRSPIVGMAGRLAFTIQMTGDGGQAGADAGVLKIGLDSEDYAPFTYVVDLDAEVPGTGATAPTFYDWQVPVCLFDETEDASFCQGALLDTGDPTAYVELADASVASSYSLPAGDVIRLVITGRGGCVFDDYTFNAHEPAINDVAVRPWDAGSPYTNLSQRAFFRYEVLFDPWNGKIGLAKRQ